MANTISIIEAQYADVATLIKINWDSMEGDVLTGFLSPMRRDLAIQKHEEFLTNVLGRRFISPTNRCHVHKAVDTKTGDIVGWSLVRWEDGKITVPPEPEKDEFRPHYVRAVTKAWLELCGGLPHVVIGGLYVAPAYQGRGIGTRLVENIYTLYNLEQEPVVVQTRAKTESFYAKLGWKTVVSADLDLSRWAGKGMGYGVHRSPQMLRDPNGVLEKRKVEQS